MCGFLFSSDVIGKTQKLESSLKKLEHRGPDDLTILELEKAWLGFTRLAVMDLTHHGDQPFVYESKSFMCNGEIYNYKALKNEFEFPYESESDCEVLIPLFESLGIKKMLERLDGEFAFVIYDEAEDKVFAARDPMGIRPLFYGETDGAGKIAFASEVKALQDFCSNIKAFPPGHYYLDGEIKEYIDLTSVKEYKLDEPSITSKKIHELLVSGVTKRLDADAPLGFLLSGGLDSSLVCAIAQKHSKEKIKTFAVGMEHDAIDLKYAKEVAEYIGSDHTEVIITKNDVLSSIKDVVYSLETFDITTIRASLGMYLICKYIKKNTKVKALMTGEVSDELFGYKYTDFAPSPAEFQKEAAKRIQELYMYDVLRADRCISAHSLEARVPFSDTEFVQYVMSIDPKIKMNTYGHGKYLLRKAFEQGDYLPQSILYREKAAFSDAVGHSMVDFIKEHAEKVYSQKEVDNASLRFKDSTPFTKESLLYRELFEEFYPGKSYLVSGFWMPNKEWDNCDVADPSARVLPNYGASGQ